MENRQIAELVDTTTSDAFNEVTDVLRDAGFTVEWTDEDHGSFEISTPDGYDESSSETVSEIAYQNRVEAEAKRFIQELLTETRLFQEVPGSIPLQSLIYEGVLETIEFEAFDPMMVLSHSDSSPPPNHHMGTRAVDTIEREFRAMYAKDIASQACELVEGTEETGWTPKWDAIQSNDEYECYVYDEESDEEVDYRE